MAPTRLRRSVSSSYASEAGVAELQKQLRTLTEDTSRVDNKAGSSNMQKKLHAGHCIRQSLLDSSNAGHFRDAFRHIDGFEAVIVALEHASKDYVFNQSKTEETRVLLGLLQVLLSILSAALQEHKGNQRYFTQRIDGGGWKVLEKCCKSLLLCGQTTDIPILEAVIEPLFGGLLSCALVDEHMVGFFGRLKRHIHGARNHDYFSGDSKNSSNLTDLSSNGTSNAPESNQETASIIREFVIKETDSLTVVYNPEATAVMLDLWKTLRITSVQGSQSQDHLAHIFSGVPSVLSRLAALSTHNLLALHSSGLLSIVISYLIASSSSSSTVPNIDLCNLTVTLLQLGVTRLDEAHELFRNANSSPLIANTLLLSLKNSHSPPYIHFDLSMHGFSSIEIPNLGQGFPPLPPSAGYTLLLWIFVVNYDSNAHTTLFGAFDSSQTCFVLLYLEKDTRNLILQTSVTSSRPSVRFKSTTFVPQRWYHISIAHRRAKAMSSSRASLFVNGEFVEQVKSHYPASPWLIKPTIEESGPHPSNRASNPIQAFLGTPQDLASRLGRGLVSSQWRLASAHLVGDLLSDDLIAVYHQLGPRYNGNYQDCLGSFQTYRASAALNLRNECLHPGKEEKSDIITAIRSKASCLLPEYKFLLNISPTAVLDDEDQNYLDESQLIKYLSKLAMKNFQNITRGGRNALAINGSIPSINEALLHPSGFAVLTGDPAVIIPQSLDDTAWRIGGCAAVCLALLEAAHTSDAVVRALKILFESIKESWRNSEAMERENGFGVLANLLVAKLRPGNFKMVNGTQSPSAGIHGDLRSSEMLSMEVLALVLKFVGYRVEKPEDSVLDNPLAYRVLLVDLDIWRAAAPSVQELYYEQFTIFGVNSKYHQFNIKRLSRMRW